RAGWLRCGACHGPTRPPCNRCGRLRRRLVPLAEPSWFGSSRRPAVSSSRPSFDGPRRFRRFCRRPYTGAARRLYRAPGRRLRRRCGGLRCRHDRLRDPDCTWTPLPSGLSRHAEPMLRFLAAIGAVFLAFLAASGRIVKFGGLELATAFTPPFYLRAVLREMVSIGYFSLPVVGLTAIFTGMVLALQSHTGFSRFAAEGAVATVVVLSVTRELGPVIAALMVAGRVGAAMAAE